MNETFSHPTRNILIAVDVQNDFIDGGLAVPNGIEVVDPLNDLARYVRASTNGRVIDTRDWHPRETPHFDTWPVHCVQGTRGAEFHPKLDVHRSDVIISKGMGQTDGYSGMEGHNLQSGQTIESLITPHGKESVRVLLGGLATDYCVKATMLDIAKRFKLNDAVSTILIRDAVRAVNIKPRDEAEAIRAMEHAGAIAMTAQEVKRNFIEIAS